MGINCIDEVVSERISFLTPLLNNTDFLSVENGISRSLALALLVSPNEVSCTATEDLDDTFIGIECELPERIAGPDDGDIDFNRFGIFTKPSEINNILALDCFDNFDEGLENDNYEETTFEEISECENIFEDEDFVNLGIVLDDICVTLLDRLNLALVYALSGIGFGLFSIVLLLVCLYCNKREKTKMQKKMYVLQNSVKKNETLAIKVQQPPIVPILEVRSVAMTSISIGSLNTILTTDSYRSLVSAVDISSQKEIKAINREQSRKIVQMVKEGNTELDMTLDKLIQRIVDDLDYGEVSDNEVFADFSLEDVPEMRLEEFLERLGFGINQWYREEEEDPDTAHLCFLFAIGYIKSLQKNKGLQLTENNVHCLFAICVLVAAKILEDDPISLEFWSDACGIDLDDILSLEKKLCFAIGFDVYFTADEYKALVMKYK